MTTRVAVDRVVEIIHDAGEGRHPRYRVGSGFLVGGTIVLTAGHVVGDGELTVRLEGSRRYEAPPLQAGRRQRGV